MMRIPVLCLLFFLAGLAPSAGASDKASDGLTAGFREALHDPLPGILRIAVRRSGTIGEKNGKRLRDVIAAHPAVQPAEIGALLSDDDPVVRAGALRVLAKMGNRTLSQISQIAPLLGDKNSSVRGAAIDTVLELGPQASALADAVWQMVRREGFGGYRAKAIRAIGKMEAAGARYARNIVPMLKAARPRVRNAASEALGRLRQYTDEHVAGVVEILRSDVDNGPNDALSSVRRFTRDLRKGHSENCKENCDLSSEQEKKRAAAVRRLFEIRRQLATPPEAWFVKASAVATVLKMSQYGPVDAPPIADLAVSKAPAVRFASALAYGYVAEIGPADMARLRRSLDDEDWRVRYASLQAMSAHAKEAAIYAARVAEFLEDDWGQVQAAAARVLGAMGPTARPHVEALLNKIAGPKPHFATFEFADAIHRIGLPEPGKSATIARLLRHQTGRVRKLAVQLIKDDDAIWPNHATDVVRLLEDDDSSVWFEACMAIGKFKSLDDGNVRYIASLLSSKRDKTLQAALLAIEQLGAVPDENLPDLVRILRRRDRFGGQATRALISVGKAPSHMIYQLASGLADRRRRLVRAYAAMLSAAFAATHEAMTPYVAAAARDDKELVRGAVATQFLALGDARISLLLQILDNSHRHRNLTAESRFIAYQVSRSDVRQAHLIAWLGNPQSIPFGKAIADPAYAAVVLKVLHEAWLQFEKIDQLPASNGSGYRRVSAGMRAEVADRIRELASSVAWRPEDEPILALIQKDVRQGARGVWDAVHDARRQIGE